MGLISAKEYIRNSHDIIMCFSTSMQLALFLFSEEDVEQPFCQKLDVIREFLERSEVNREEIEESLGKVHFY